jgi:hypothetical protein
VQDYSLPIAPATTVPVNADVRRPALVGMMVLFGTTMFTGSGLLFLVQPMFAKLILPRLGGSPAVWNTCILFFQATLLLGYLYAHLSTRWLGLRRQIVCHLLLLLVPVLVLPLSAGGAPPSSSDSPVWWLLRTMALTVGLPFFVVATSAPLLQKWFAALPVPSARDPYFLYSASNLGSMVALLGYPLVVEPLVGTRQQTWWWSGGYLILAALFVVCAVSVVSYAAEKPVETASDDADGASHCSNRERIQWIVLSFVPSSLMLGVTTHISTDIAAVPMLWVAPLALYLATFVIAFSSGAVARPAVARPLTGRDRVSLERWLARALPALIFGCLLTVLFNARLASLIALHVLTFFVVALVCHRELARRRPAAIHLTEFYLCMSFGGMLGGVFNSLVAPHLFAGILEYPIVLAAAALLRPSPGYRRNSSEPWPLLVGLPLCALLVCAGMWRLGVFPADVGVNALLLSFATLLTIAYIAANRTQPFNAMCLAFLCLIAFGRPASSGTVLLAARSFFGVYRVIDAPDHAYHVLQHGSTTHGREEMTVGDRCLPTGYYHPSSPIGELIDARHGHLENVAVVGLGSGAMACYAEPGRPWTFYEIDPLVERVARDSRYFSYLHKSRGRLNVVLGDARISLQHANDHQYDLIVLDAFSSDAIPVHLLTQEAVELYLSKLQSTGVVAIHISNRYLNLEPILTAVAERTKLFAISKLDDRPSDADAKFGKFPSHWVMLAPAKDSLEGVAAHPGWRSLRSHGNLRVWTDDYSNILQAFER